MSPDFPIIPLALPAATSCLWQFSFLVRRRHVLAYLSVSLVFNELKIHQRTRRWNLKPPSAAGGGGVFTSKLARISEGSSNVG